MRKDIDPIKIIQILPFSNRPEKPPEGPNPLWELVKNAFRTARETVARLLRTIQGGIARVGSASSMLYARLAARVRLHKREAWRKPEPVSRPDGESLSTLPTDCAEPSPNVEHHAPRAWLRSVRESIKAAWPVRRARLEIMKGKLAGDVLEWRQKISRTWWTEESWRTKTDPIVRPLTSAVRSLRRRHHRLLDQLNSTHSIVQGQQQEITQLALQLASMKTEVASHKKTIEELAHQVASLQRQVAQRLPMTHGTTGQSGPPPQGRRGPAASKRNGPGETGPQSKAEH